MAFVYELPWMRESSSILGYVVKNWQVNGIYSAFSGTPFRIAGNNPQLLARRRQQSTPTRTAKST